VTRYLTKVFDRCLLLTVALIFGITLGLVYAYVLSSGNSFIAPLLAAPFILLGAIGVRLAGPWRQTVLAAFLSGIGLIVFSRFEFSPLFPGPWVPGDSGMVLDFRSGAIFLDVCSAGVLLLPLFDPVVRKAGLAPTLWKVALTALILVLLSLLVDYLLFSPIGGELGLVALIIGSILSAVLAGTGLILALANLTAVGAWVGGLGIALQAFILAAWWLLGSPWFP
jgi:hypothetical protein